MIKLIGIKVAALGCWGALACSAQAQPPVTAQKPIEATTQVVSDTQVAASSSELEEAPAPRAVGDLAAACTERPCSMSHDAVAQLCAATNADAALGMFVAGSPWRRAYIRVNSVDPVNTLGPSSDVPLLLDEEVLVLDDGAAKGGEMVIAGMVGHHVLRLDGTCATVMQDELTSARPPSPHHAELRWSHLDTKVQEALLVDAAVKDARHAQRNTCKGSFALNADDACVHARERLSAAIVKALARPVTLPEVSLRAL